MIVNRNYHLVNNHLRSVFIKMINFIIENKSNKEKNKKKNKKKDKNNKKDKGKDKKENKGKSKSNKKNNKKTINLKYGIRSSLNINHNQINQ